MSSPTPSPERKKPSALASCILLGIILGLLGGVGGGGYWAYKHYIAAKKPAEDADPGAVAKTDPTPAKTPAKTPATEPAKTPDKPAVASTDTKPANSPLDAKPAVADTTPVKPPVTPDAPPMKDPLVPPPPVTPVTPPGADTTPVTPTTPAADTAAAESNPDPVVAPEPVQTFAGDAPEVTALKADAGKRIDDAPPERYTDADKDRVRQAIQKAKRLTRVATLQFGNGASDLGAKEKTRLRNALLSKESEDLLSDANSVFFLIGFADAKGTPEINRKISLDRATGVSDVLKGFKVANASYPVGIGTSTLVDAKDKTKNRAVEVWIVQP